MRFEKEPTENKGEGAIEKVGNDNSEPSFNEAVGNLAAEKVESRERDLQGIRDIEARLDLNLAASISEVEEQINEYDIVIPSTYPGQGGEESPKMENFLPETILKDARGSDNDNQHEANQDAVNEARVAEYKEYARYGPVVGNIKFVGQESGKEDTFPVRATRYENAEKDKKGLQIAIMYNDGYYANALGRIILSEYSAEELNKLPEDDWRRVYGRGDTLSKDEPRVW